ncbi:hypothetical protein ACFSLT_11275 [Novosphingobium resinovorum]
MPLTYDLGIDFDAVTLRDAARHGGADLGLTVAPRYTLRSGAGISPPVCAAMSSSAIRGRVMAN